MADRNGNELPPEAVRSLVQTQGQIRQRAWHHQAVIGLADDGSLLMRNSWGNQGQQRWAHSIAVGTTILGQADNQQLMVEAFDQQIRRMMQAGEISAEEAEQFRRATGREIDDMRGRRESPRQLSLPSQTRDSQTGDAEAMPATLNAPANMDAVFTRNEQQPPTNRRVSSADEAENAAATGWAGTHQWLASCLRQIEFGTPEEISTSAATLIAIENMKFAGYQTTETTAYMLNGLIAAGRIPASDIEQMEPHWLQRLIEYVLMFDTISRHEIGRRSLRGNPTQGTTMQRAFVEVGTVYRMSPKGADGRRHLPSFGHYAQAAIRERMSSLVIRMQAAAQDAAIVAMQAQQQSSQMTKRHKAELITVEIEGEAELVEVDGKLRLLVANGTVVSKTDDQRSHDRMRRQDQRQRKARFAEQARKGTTRRIKLED